MPGSVLSDVSELRAVPWTLAKFSDSVTCQACLREPESIIGVPDFAAAWSSDDSDDDSLSRRFKY
jgi:hypothetical protein